MIEVGRVYDIARYPVKSMAGQSLESAVLGWYGLAGDRRFAFRRIDDRGGFPVLSASQYPELLLYQPHGMDDSAAEPVPTHVRTPSGPDLELASEELAAAITERSGYRVELLRLRHGIFDEGAVSVITTTTIAGIGREAGLELNRRRFRANVIVETADGPPFSEDAWVGRTMRFGDGKEGPALSITIPDERCMMINLSPDTAEQDGRVMKTVVGMNGNNAGVYATPVACGRVQLGDRVWVSA
ncbi:MAG: MOSC domain-containing protein [Gemmatimonadaceae bacterium]